MLIAGTLAKASYAGGYDWIQINDGSESVVDFYNQLQQIETECRSIAPSQNGNAGSYDYNINVSVPPPSEGEIWMQNQILQIGKETQKIVEELEAQNNAFRAQVGEEEYQRIRAATFWDRQAAACSAQAEKYDKQRHWNAKFAKSEAQTGYWKATGERFNPNAASRPHECGARQNEWDHAKRTYNIYRDVDR